jgi:malate synthase
VAHPDLVPTAKKVFEDALDDQPHQKFQLRADVATSAPQLIDFRIPGGTITEAGLRTNINVGILYLEAWLRGNGAVALYNLMEDAATAEISRAQVWQWTHHATAALADGRKVTPELYKRLLSEEIARIQELAGTDAFAAGKYAQAIELFDSLVSASKFNEFLTLGAYEVLE